MPRSGMKREEPSPGVPLKEISLRRNFFEKSERTFCRRKATCPRERTSAPDCECSHRCAGRPRRCAERPREIRISVVEIRISHYPCYAGEDLTYPCCVDTEFRCATEPSPQYTVTFGQVGKVARRSRDE